MQKVYSLELLEQLLGFFIIKIISKDSVHYQFLKIYSFT